MTDNHPTPPPELVEQLRHEAPHNIRDTIITREVYLITAAYRAGADQELEACCEALARELICDGKHVATDLRSVRRPKPPSLKEQALKTLQKLSASDYPCNYQEDEDWGTIRRALEQLDD